MPHALILDGVAEALHDTRTFGEPDVTLRAHALADHRLVLIAADSATCDGVPLLGNLAVIEHGEGALVRTGATRLEIVWQGRCEAAAAPYGQSCRLCFGTLVPGESAVRCSCDSWFHAVCHQARRNCPACGAPSEDL